MGVAGNGEGLSVCADGSLAITLALVFGRCALSLANSGSHKAALVKIRSWSMKLGNLIGGCPMGEARTLPHPR